MFCNVSNTSDACYSLAYYMHALLSNNKSDFTFSLRRTSGKWSTFSAAQSSLSGSLNGSVCVVSGTHCIWETVMAESLFCLLLVLQQMRKFNRIKLHILGHKIW